MIMRNLTADNDWTFGKGLQNYAREEQAVELNLKTRLQAYLTECFFDPELGVPWFNALGSKDKTVILIETKKVIAESYGVTEVIDLSFNINEAREAVIRYGIKTIYTKQGQKVTGEVTI